MPNVRRSGSWRAIVRTGVGTTMGSNADHKTGAATLKVSTSSKCTAAAAPRTRPRVSELVPVWFSQLRRNPGRPYRCDFNVQVAWLTVSLGCLSAWLAAAEQQAVFRTGTRVVPIYATVTSADGRLLTGLTQGDFVVLDDGRPRQITVFSDRSVAITGLAMWDVSPAMAKNQTRSRAAARALVDSLWPDDR